MSGRNQPKIGDKTNRKQRREHKEKNWKSAASGMMPSRLMVP
jgi:hypothetical protein